MFIHHAQDEYGSTPLIVACGKNHPEVASFLIKNGADVNLQTKVVSSPLSVDYVSDFLTIGPWLHTTSLCQSKWPHSCGEAVA